MLNKKVYILPEKVIKVHKTVQERDNFFSVKQNDSTFNRELICMASRCLELNKRLRMLYEENSSLQ